MNIPNTYQVVLTKTVDADLLFTYWKDLEDADTLKYRFSDTLGISAQEAYDHSITIHHHYCVIDCGNGNIVSELALDTFTGRAAQVHYSMHPDNPHSLNRYLFDAVSDLILNYWKGLGTDKPFLDTVFGLTPVANRVACIFALRSNFKKVGVLPRGTYYLGDTVDSLVTAKTRNI